MDRKLNIIRHLYGEDVDRTAFRALLQGEDGFKEEHDALSEVKFYLDHRKRVRPDPHVVDAVVEAAAQQAAPPGRPARGPDRAAVRRRSFGRSRLLGLTSAALALLLAAGIGLWQVLPPAGDGVFTAEQAAAPQRGSLLSDSVDPAAASRAGAAKAGPAAPAGQLRTVGVQGGVAWDDAFDVRRLHRRIEMLEVRASDLSWDEPVVTPEMLLPEHSLPDAGQARWGLNPTSQQRFLDSD